jgi:hypothetical protein
VIISEQIAELVGALAKAQGSMPSALRSSTNPHFRSKYADLAAIREAAREPLATNGLSIVQGIRTVPNGLECETILFHASGQSIRETLTIPVGKMDAQSLGSAATYARRYSLMSLLGLASEDDDGESAAASINGGKSAPGVTGPISPAQADELKMDIIHSDADLPRFLKTFGISRIEEMPAARFAEAKHKLELKLQQTLREEGSDA